MKTVLMDKNQYYDISNFNFDTMFLQVYHLFDDYYFIKIKHVFNNEYKINKLPHPFPVILMK